MQQTPEKAIPVGGRTVISFSTNEDERFRRAVLDHILALHPHRHLRIPALVQEMLAGSAHFGGGAELECAIRDCVCKGLLSIKRGRLWPTQLALESEEETQNE